MKEIKNHILSGARKREREILSQASREKKELLAKEREEIMQEVSRTLAAGKREAELERQRLVSGAKLEARRAIMAAKEELIASVLGKARERLEKHIGEPSYGKTLEMLAKESIAEAGAGAEIYVRKQDMKYVKGSREREMGPGVIAVNGGVYLDNTLETRLSRAEGGIRSEIGRILFK